MNILMIRVRLNPIEIMKLIIKLIEMLIEFCILGVLAYITYGCYRANVFGCTRIRSVTTYERVSSEDNTNDELLLASSYCLTRASIPSNSRFVSQSLFIKGIEYPLSKQLEVRDFIHRTLFMNYLLNHNDIVLAKSFLPFVVIDLTEMTPINSS